MLLISWLSRLTSPVHHPSRRLRGHRRARARRGAPQRSQFRAAEALESRVLLAAFSGGEDSLSLGFFLDGETLDVYRTSETEVQFVLGDAQGDVWTGIDDTPPGLVGDGLKTLTLNTESWSGTLVVRGGDAMTLRFHGGGELNPFPFRADVGIGGGLIQFVDAASVFEYDINPSFFLAGSIQVDAPLEVRNADLYFQALGGGSIVVNAPVIADLSVNWVSDEITINDTVRTSAGSPYTGEIRMAANTSFFLNGLVQTGDAIGDAEAEFGGATSGGIDVRVNYGSLIGNSAGRLVTGNATDARGFGAVSGGLHISAAGEVRLAATEALKTGDATSLTFEDYHSDTSSGGIDIQTATRLSSDGGTGKLSVAMGSAHGIYDQGTYHDWAAVFGHLSGGTTGDPISGPIYVTSPTDLYVGTIVTAADSQQVVEIENTSGNMILENSGSDGLMGDDITFRSTSGQIYWHLHRGFPIHLGDGSLTLTADEIILVHNWWIGEPLLAQPDSIRGTGRIVLQPATPSRNIRIGGSELFESELEPWPWLPLSLDSDALSLSHDDLLAIRRALGETFSEIIIGRETDGTGTVYLDGYLEAYAKLSVFGGSIVNGGSPDARISSHSLSDPVKLVAQTGDIGTALSPIRVDAPHAPVEALAPGEVHVTVIRTSHDLDNASVLENLGSVLVGTLQPADPASSETFTYTLVNTESFPHNALFTIEDGNLLTLDSFDFETQDRYLIRVRSTDSQGDWTEKPFTISILDENEFAVGPVTDEDWAPNEIAETLPAGPVGITAFAGDADGSNNAVTYSLTGDAGGLFTIDAATGVVSTTGPLDYETATSHTITVRADSSDGSFSTADFVIDVLDLVQESNPPVIAAFPTTVPKYTENAAPVVVGGGTVSDPDLVDFDGGTLTVSLSESGTTDDRLGVRHVGFNAKQIGVSGGNITYGTDGTPENALVMANFTGGVGTEPLVITFNANALAVHVTAVLKAVNFHNVSDDPSTAPRMVQFVVIDGDGGTSDVVTRAVTLIARNDAPVITTSASELNYVEGGAPIILDGGATVFDLDSPDFDTGRVTVKIAAGAQSTDRLGIESSGPISVNELTSEVSYEGVVIGAFAGTTTLTVTLNAQATPEAVQELLRHITFSSISQAPSTVPRSITFSLKDGDGGTSAAAAAATVTVTALNDAPVIGAFPTTVAKYTENAVPVVIGGGTVTEPDLLDFDGGTLTVTLSEGGTADDRLALRHVGFNAKQIGVDGGNITYGTDGTPENALVAASFTGGDGTDPLVITFNANALAVHVTAVLKAVTFRDVSDDPSTNPRTVSFELTDGDGGTSNVVTRAVNVIARNDAPLVAIGGDVNWTPGGDPTLISTGATVTDPDSADLLGGKLIVALTLNKQSLDRIEVQEGNGITISGTTVSYNGNAIGTLAGTTTLTVTFTTGDATPEAIQALLRQVSFRSTSSSTLPRTVTVRLTDGDGGTSVAAFKTISIG